MADQGAGDTLKTWTVSLTGEVRLDTFARRCMPHLSRRQLDEAIRDGRFSVHGKAAAKGDRLHSGDVLVFRGPQSWLAGSPFPNDSFDVPIVYEDDAILVLDKPAAMATHGFSGQDRLTLANFLAAKYPELIGVGRTRWQPGLVHRLDGDTSGLVLVAKTQKTFDQLARLFRLRQIHKTYLALVWGETAPRGEITLPLGHDEGDKRRMTAVTSRARGKKTWPAITRYERLGAARKMTLLKVDMETGVMHQIRAHLSAAGHAIVADKLYGAAGAESMDLNRHFLHAWKLAFAHPADGCKVRLQSDLPSDLRGVLNGLGLKEG